MNDIELGDLGHQARPNSEKPSAQPKQPTRSRPKIVPVGPRRLEELAEAEIDIFHDGNASRFMTFVFFAYCMFNACLGVDIVYEFESTLGEELKYQVAFCALKWFTSVFLVAGMMAAFFLLCKLQCVDNGQICSMIVGATLPCYATLVIAQQTYASLIAGQYLAHEAEDVEGLSSDGDFLVSINLFFVNEVVVGAMTFF